MLFQGRRGSPTSLDLSPEEFLSGWEPSASRLFLAALAGAKLGARVALRITIRGTGISATVAGTVNAVRHAAGAGLPPGGYLAVPARNAGSARYLAQVARGLPVEFNERDPRYAVSWGMTLVGGPGRFAAFTENVSPEGCALAWRGVQFPVGCWVTVRRRLLLAPALPAQVRWSTANGELATAGLRLHLAGRVVISWRHALDREVRRGARLI